MARRSRDGKEQSAEGVTKMQRQSGFYIRRLPPVAYGSRPPSQRGAKNPHLCPAIPEPSWLPIRASEPKICVILSAK